MTTANNNQAMNYFGLSPDTANLLLNVSNVSLVLGAILVALGTAGAIWSSLARDRYADQRTEVNEAKTALAQATAAVAQQKTAELTVRAAELEHKAAEANARAAEANERIQKMQRPRRLGKQHAGALTPVLQSLAGMKTSAGKGRYFLGVGSVADSEAETYAIDFLELFKECGVNVYPTPGGSFPRGIAQLEASDAGLGLFVKPGIEKGHPFTLIYDAIAAIGIPVSIGFDDTQLTTDHAQLNVLTKPPVV